MADSNFTADVMALVPRVLPEAVETIRIIRETHAELMAIRAQTQPTETAQAA